MKKILVMLLASSMLVCFSGCKTDIDISVDETTVETTQESPESVSDIEADGEYEYLEEFINAICSYSDPPYFESEEEYDEYFKEQYDMWMSGEAYENIVLNENGEIKIDGGIYQFSGLWYNTAGDRCSMSIVCMDEQSAFIEIDWANSAYESSHWTFDAVYSEDDNSLVYENGSCYQQYYNDDGSIDETLVYDNGTGSFKLDENGEIYWQDDMENAGESALFAKEVFSDSE